MFRRAKVTEDAIVAAADTKGQILSVLVTAGASATVVSIYDGQDTNGTLLHQIKTSTSVADTNLFVQYVNGLYVDIDANTANCVLVYEGAAK